MKPIRSAVLIASLFTLFSGMPTSVAADGMDGYGELRIYPAGGIASVGALIPEGQRTELGVSVLFNRAERGDAGKHDHESGNGFGFGIEARRFIAPVRTGWFYGVRAELFRSRIAWRDDGGLQGNSDITVFQPTARLGYRIGQSRVELAASLGAEINLSTQGAEVGEGAIGLLGVSYLLW